MKAVKMICAAVAVAMAASCSHTGDAPGEAQWTVSGTIDGAAGHTLRIENADNSGRWVAVDSVKVADDGSFTYSGKRPAYPDIYRLSVDGRSLYFPIDSIEHITVSGTMADFQSRAKIDGSASAQAMQAINDVVNAYVDSLGLSGIADSDNMRRDLAQVMQADWSGIASYYAVIKRVGGVPLFDPANKLDGKIIAAVANAFNSNRPDDPRTKMLRDITLAIQVAHNPEAFGPAQVQFPEIVLKDKTGKERSLTELWREGHAVILNFTLYEAEESPALNILLNKVYSDYADRGLEIYQVVCDDNEYRWMQAVQPIPWVSVFNTDVTNLLKYNVQAIPTTYVISRDGEQFTRVDRLSELDEIVRRSL